MPQLSQELALLSLHLLQVSLVYINTLMVEQVLKAERWQNRLNAEDLRALTPLFYGHVTPYGIFDLDRDTRMVLEQAGERSSENQPIESMLVQSYSALDGDEKPINTPRF